MTPEQLKTLLYRAGYHIEQTCPKDNVCITDPTCIWPILGDFINFAWIVLAVITGFLLAGWAATMLRGASHSIVKNLRDLVLIFGVLSVAIPAINLLGGGKFIYGQCNVIQVSQEQIDQLTNNKTMKQPEYEYFNITDSAYDTPEPEFGF